MTPSVPFSRRDRLARLQRIGLVSLLALLPLTLVAQQPNPNSWADEIIAKEGYAQPPKELVDAVLAPRHLNTTLSNLSPDRRWFLDEVGDGMVMMDRFSVPFHELGGVFIDYQAHRSRTLTRGGSIGIQVISAADGSKKPVAVPANTRVSSARWTPDGAGVAYLAHTPTATHVWITDLASNKPRQITKTPLLATLVTNFEFTNDGKQIAAVIIPDGRKPMPVKPQAPTGPEIRVAQDNDRNRLRTYPSLMKTPHEFDLLEWHSTGQLALIDVQSQAVTKFGAPQMFRSFDFSPDGKHARIVRMTKPFSYIVPAGNFGQVEEVWDGTGKVLAELSKRELNLGVQSDTDPDPDPQAQPGGGRGGGAPQTGKRDIAWRPDGQGFTYLEQEAPPPGSAAGGGAAGRAGRGARTGGGGGGDEAPQGGRQGGPPRPDRLYHWMPPFDASSAKVMYENSTRMNGVRFSPDMKIVFFSETSNNQNTEVAVYLDAPTQKYVLQRSRAGGGGRGAGRGADDAPPTGTLMSRGGGAGGGGGRGGGRGGGGGGGGPVLLSADGSSVFYSGTINDRNPQEVGPKTFIDRVAIKTGEKERVFESNNSGVWERVSTVLDIDAKRFILTSESPTSVPQQFLVENGQRKQLTNNEDLAPDLTSAPKQRFVVERPDGFKFRVTVTLPPGYQTGTKLPAMFWFYPREYTTQEQYDQPERTFNKNTFQTFGARSMAFLVRLGYAVVEPDSPIVGVQGEMNNNYVHDLRNNLAAVIDELDRRGIADRTRLGIGGHSYGAFSTVNAMVHTPFFKAGIAGDGAYNRTLTPLGFQSERRDFWQAPQVYTAMSPFFYANNLTGALLMYHGMHDQNVGTDPINSIRLFHALNGLGKTVALYMYPLEDHGPATRETTLDLWARWSAWLHKYVKNPVKPDKPNQAPGGGNGR
jgi:dipeptidyl aminopeptidase/acylaminoacyl peptidase